MFALGQEGEMPDIDAIQAENERLVAASHQAENKAESMNDLKNQMQSEIELILFKFGIGGIAVIVAVYWFLIKR